MNVIGLGAAGCAIADALDKYPQYDVYKLDNGLERKGNTYPIAKQNSHEDYDKHPPKLTQFISRMKKSDSVLFIMGGGGAISGASLQVLKQLHNRWSNSIDIMYVKPDIELLSELGRLRDRLCCRVLQEYTRSGVFRSILLVSNPHIEAAIGDVPVKNYYENMNNFLSYAYHMQNVFRNTEPEISSLSENKPEHVRLWTIGIMDAEKNEEKLFFPIDSPSEKCYYYGINENRLETDGKLLKEVRQQVKKKSVQAGAPCSYAIHSTSYEEDMAYVTCWSSQIQAYPEIHQSL